MTFSTILLLTCHAPVAVTIRARPASSNKESLKWIPLVPMVDRCLLRMARFTVLIRKRRYVLDAVLLESLGERAPQVVFILSKPMLVDQNKRGRFRNRPLLLNPSPISGLLICLPGLNVSRTFRVLHNASWRQLPKTYFLY